MRKDGYKKGAGAPWLVHWKKKRGKNRNTVREEKLPGGPACYCKVMRVTGQYKSDYRVETGAPGGKPPVLL